MSDFSQNHLKKLCRKTFDYLVHDVISIRITKSKFEHNCCNILSVNSKSSFQTSLSSNVILRNFRIMSFTLGCKCDNDFNMET